MTDLAIMGRPPDGLDIATQSFMDNPLVVVAPPDHPLCAARRIPVKRLEQETFLVREPVPAPAAPWRGFLGARINISRGMETDTNEAIKQAVQAGMGLAIMSLHTVELELETKRQKCWMFRISPSCSTGT